MLVWSHTDALRHQRDRAVAAPLCRGDMPDLELESMRGPRRSWTAQCRRHDGIKPGAKLRVSIEKGTSPERATEWWIRRARVHLDPMLPSPLLGFWNDGWRWLP